MQSIWSIGSFLNYNFRSLIFMNNRSCVGNIGYFYFSD